MAYLDVPLPPRGCPHIVAAWSTPVPVTEQAAAVARSSALEIQVSAIAKRDPPSSLHRPGVLSTVLGTLFGRNNPRLADAKLEALRRIAVLNWRRGYSVSPQEVHAFTDAGYTPEHHESLLDSIFATRARQ